MVGILLAYLSNFVIARMGFGATEWRWQFGVAALAAALFLVGGVGYAISTDDWAADLTALVTTGALAWAYPVIAHSSHAPRRSIRSAKGTIAALVAIAPTAGAHPSIPTAGDPRRSS